MSNADNETNKTHTQEVGSFFILELRGVRMKFFYSYVPIMFLKFSMHSTIMFLIGPQFIPNPLPKVLPFSLI
jgi:hypothetical protein